MPWKPEHLRKNTPTGTIGNQQKRSKVCRIYGVLNVPTYIVGQEDWVRVTACKTCLQTVHVFSWKQQNRITSSLTPWA